MFSIKKFSLFLFVVFLLNGCLVVDNPFNGLPPGPWRAVLILEGGKEIPEEELDYFEVPKLKAEVVKSGELAFNFDVIYEENNPDKFHIEVINGEERFVVPSEDIIMGWDHRIGKDTITINFPIYESYIKGIYAENIIQGNWVVTTKENYKVPFEARFGQNHRFANLIKAEELNVEGKWEVTFGVDTDDPFKAIGEFIQEGNKLTGTFMTETGDYRFLEGIVYEDNIFLSCFDGAHAFLFEAKMMEDGTLTGIFRSGNHYQVLWEGKRNPDYKLRDPNSLTFLKEGYDKFAFSFKNTEGQLISLEDENLKDKVKLVQVMGTWCPNCMDETKFLIDYLSKNSNEALEVIALGFEKHDEEKSLKLLKDFKKRMNIPYEVLFAGPSGKSAAVELLPMLNHIMSYPTMIFIDKKNQVRKIHTGFAGPATSEYAAFKKDFEETVEMLLAE
jgi:thiol-disulfide isomerase/thioredoxin